MQGTVKLSLYEQEIVGRVEAMRRSVKWRYRDAAKALGLAPSTYSDKVYGVKNRFTVLELEKLAIVYRTMKKLPLVAWPFVDDNDSDLLAAARRIHSR